MKKVIFILGLLGLFISKSIYQLQMIQTETENLRLSNLQEMSETPDSALTEEVMESEPAEELESANTRIGIGFNTQKKILQYTQASKIEIH